MSSEQANEELSNELKALEAALGELRPAISRVDRDRLMYVAGQDSVARGRALSVAREQAGGRVRTTSKWWPLATAALLMVSLTLGGLLILSARQHDRENFPEQSKLDEALVAAASFSMNGTDRLYQASMRDDSSYFHLRNLVLTHGIEALPTSNSSRGNRPMELIPTPSFIGG